MKPQRKRPTVAQIVFAFVFVTLLASLVYSIVQAVGAPVAAAEAGVQVKSDYTLRIVQCVAALVVLFLPSLIEKRLRVDVPDIIEVMFFLFLYAAVYLGEVRSFYYRLPHWDTILHTFSGLMIGALGFSLVNLLNRQGNVKGVSLSPAFVALFAFLFASSMGVLWEIYEFTLDGLFQMNMQKYALEGGAALEGRVALADTMEDLVVDCIGAAVMSVIGYVSLKMNRPWIRKLFLRKLRQGEKAGSAEPPDTNNA